ncbi:hypothetical protein H5410_016571 [Solanum commersonii]|uniref:Programmed cell death protein 4-like n=1 Tax=Solanum commersonii TaxID=4109 RepID=A0A9J5ZXD2_SOLCO|nr:hypothetical protein H5410_016571 [Solanum commersonii]
MKNTSKNSKIIPKSSQDARKDRRSAPEISGSLKKGGHGGKFTWAGDGSYSSKKEEADVVVVDANDPNFDEPEENSIDES